MWLGGGRRDEVGKVLVSRPCRRGALSWGLWVLGCVLREQEDFKWGFMQSDLRFRKTFWKEGGFCWAGVTCISRLTPHPSPRLGSAQ